MAINALEKQCDKIPSKHSSNYTKGTLPSCHLLKLSITDDSVSSSDGKSSKIKKNRNVKSPYLIGDSVQLLSRVTEKKLYAQHKKGADFVSSFPLAASLYRVNSDEFKSQKRGNKKVKKSVLTLPNAPTAAPQMCTVSDTNDSKYFDRCDDNRTARPNKRLSQNRKARVRNKDYEFYDRDARYCSQMNISLDCSSTDMINQFTGDGKRITGKFCPKNESPAERKFNAHDVWAVLRNINRFQFRPSPPMSEDSIQTAKKKKTRNKRKTRKDTRVIETCRTEEFAYISSYDVDSKSPLSFSQSSSFDRITVIDKQDEFSEICKEFERSVLKTKNNNQRKNRQQANKNQNKRNAKNNNTKTIVCAEYDGQIRPENKIMRDANKSPDDTYADNVDNPETLVAVNNISTRLNSQSKCPHNTTKPTDLNVIISRPKASNGTLHSGSSKAAVNISTNFREDYGKLLKTQSNESSNHVKGISKVILSKGQDMMLSKRINEAQNRKTRLDSKLQRAVMMPKLTQTEIKRQLANMKFPIVILGKDQVCSTSIQLMNHDPPHLQGLDKQIWPFMQDWYDSSAINKDNETEVQKKCHEKPNESAVPKMKHIIERKNLRKQNEPSPNKSGGKEKASNDDTIQNKKKTHKRPVPPIEISKNKPITPKKSKPINQLKDKMLKLLYKNTSAKEVDDQCKMSVNNDSASSCIRRINMKPTNTIKKIDVGIETFMDYDLVSQTLSRNPNLCPRLEVKKMPIVAKQPWAKAKWASDFIETVMKRIRSGVYYNQENKHQYKTPNTDVSVQTILTANNFTINEPATKDEVIQKSSNETLPCVTSLNEANGYLDALPGFDESLPALEIQTLNMKEVAVKHCKTNVMVQFDIAVPSEPQELNPLQRSSSFVPLTVTESQTKIFKCKTTIINAMLPAEICSLLPKIILSIVDTNKPQALATSTVPYQSDCLLYTISELSNSESQDVFKPTLPPSHNIAPQLLTNLKGVFFYNDEKLRKNIRHLPRLHYSDSKEATSVVQKISVQQLMPCIINPISYLNPYGFPKNNIANKQNENVLLHNNKRNSCTALQLYKGTTSQFIVNTSIAVKCSHNYVENTFMEKIYLIPLLLTFDDNKIIMKITNNEEKAFEENTSIIINNVNLKSLYEGFQYRSSENRLKNKTLNAIEHKTPVNKLDKQCGQVLNAASNLKVRKNKFVKLYKKCKSTSNISGEKNSTLLSKIINLEDFLQALGTGKILSSVFDGLSEKKILSSVLEMKSWITEISQRQAMLVLLLINKKDTPNLVRFRPVLLQGIAVNRITRASELDMEIEVIETENFHKFSKFEGIPYISESVDNHDILLEELYWIAKTTASDYQKPFDEASENLLKSLLEKRKKLNPSYLRVMARYVGLGLLKPSTKN